MKKTRSKDGTTLSYDVYGTGPALIYITGAICFRKFGPIVKDAKVFANEFTVYNYDRRGRGDSTDNPPYSLEKEVEDVEAIIDAAGGHAFIYGHSSGAVLAIEAALRLPTKVKKLALYDAPYVHDEAEKQKFALLRQEVSDFLRDRQNKKALKTFLIGIGMPKIFVHALPFLPGWKALKALAPTIAYDMLLTSDLPPLARAAKITRPTFVIHGEKSPESIHAVARQLSEAIPSAQAKQIDGHDHMVSAKVLLPILSTFFKSP